MKTGLPMGVLGLFRERCKKNIKKLTNVSLYVCMSAENRKMLVFLCFFPDSSKGACQKNKTTFFGNFSQYGGEGVARIPKLL